MAKYEIETVRRKDGCVDFFYAGYCITAWWMDFFSTLSWEQERECVALFLKRNRKELKELAAKPRLTTSN